MLNQKRFNLPFGCLIAAGILAAVCGITIPMSVASRMFAPARQPTLDNNAIATAVFETALVLDLQTEASNQSLQPTGTLIPTTTNTHTPMIISTSVVIPITGAECIPGNPPQTARVIDVVDGDTIKVLLDQDGQTYTVRYIGMDTPENTSQVEYFGPEATAKNGELVNGKTVTLIKDVSETDRYGRLLRYVITDEMFVNYELVAQGYANIASFPPDIACIPTFQAAEEEASASKLGLWGAPPPTATQVILPPLPTATLGRSSGGSGGNASCNCGGPDLDCGDFNTHAAAQSCYSYCVSQGFGDIFRLDGNDNDGLACESLP